LGEPDPAPPDPGVDEGAEGAASGRDSVGPGGGQSEASGGAGSAGSGKKKTKKKKKGKGKKGAAEPTAFTINWDAMSPAQRAAQEELLALGADLGLRSPPPKPGPAKGGKKGKKGKKDKKVAAASAAAAAAAPPPPPAPTLYTLVQECHPHAELPLCTCSHQLLPGKRRTLLPELDQAVCAVHGYYLTRPDRVKAREESQWMAAALARRVDMRFTAPGSDMHPGVEPSVLSRSQAYALIEAYTEALEKLGPEAGAELAELHCRRAAVFAALGRSLEALQVGGCLRVSARVCACLCACVRVWIWVWLG
jgi:hypothetical protein